MSLSNNILGIDITQLPTSGTAYNRVLSLSQQSGTLNLSDNTGPNNDILLAKAVMGDSTGVNNMLNAATNRNGTGPYVPMGPGRNLIAWAIAASIAGLTGQASWFLEVRDRPMLDGGKNLLEHTNRANNHGIVCEVALFAIDAFLGNQTTHFFDTVMPRFKNRIDQIGSFTYSYGSTVYQPNPSSPVVVCQPGTTVNGINSDGTMPEEQRRASPFPNCNGYVVATPGYMLIGAELLRVAGQTAVYTWGSSGIQRLFAANQRIGCTPGSITGDDVWQGYMIKAIFGTAYGYPLAVGDGKSFGLTDWLYSVDTSGGSSDSNHNVGPQTTSLSVVSPVVSGQAQVTVPAKATTLSTTPTVVTAEVAGAVDVPVTPQALSLSTGITTFGQATSVNVEVPTQTLEVSLNDHHKMHMFLIRKDHGIITQEWGPRPWSR